MIEHMDQVAAVTAGIALIGLLIDAGRKAQQLSDLREWRKAADLKLDKLLEQSTAIHTILERRRE